ncbi:MAG: heat shock protein HspQ [Candidatus Binatia bacterium]
MGHQAKFPLGQVICHRLFGYRGVVVDADPTFQGSEEWYNSVARSRPPRNMPWYRVLVHDSDELTYVAERNLEADDSGDPVEHPELSRYFGKFRGGVYCPTRPLN